MRISNGRELLWCAEHEIPAIKYRGGTYFCYGRTPAVPQASCRFVPVEEAEVPEEEPDPMARLREAAKKLGDYTTHRVWCDWVEYSASKCDCGLEQARKMLLAQ